MTIVWALTWLGQSAALAALTAAFVRLPGFRERAATRYAAWAVTLFICAGLLAWPLVPAAATAPTLRSASGAAGVQAAVRWPPGRAPGHRSPGCPGGSAGSGRLAQPSGWRSAARDVWRVVRLKRRTVPLSTEEQARLGAGLAAWTSSRAPRLAWCDELDSPAVLGFPGPGHCPAALAGVVPVGRAVPARRAARTGSCPPRRRLVGPRRASGPRSGVDEPGVHWVRRELSLSREMACDEWVVRQTAAPVAYAKCLTDVAGLRMPARRLRLAAGVNGRPGTLRRRIVGVLELEAPTARARAVAIVSWLAPVAVCVVAAGVAATDPGVRRRRTRRIAAAPAQVPSGPAETGARGAVGRAASATGSRTAAGPQTPRSLPAPLIRGSGCSGACRGRSATPRSRRRRRRTWWSSRLKPSTSGRSLRAPCPGRVLTA